MIRTKGHLQLARWIFHPDGLWFRLRPASRSMFVFIFGQAAPLGDERGKLSSTLSELGEGAGIHPKSVRYVLRDLENAGVIRTSSRRGLGTEIEVLNFDDLRTGKGAGDSIFEAPDKEPQTPIHDGSNGVSDSNPRSPTLQLKEPQTPTNGAVDSKVPIRNARAETTETSRDLGRPQAGPPTQPKRRKRAVIDRPAHWSPSPAHHELACELGIDLSSEARAFADWHDSKGNRFADWDAAFRTWLRRATEYGRAKPARARPPKELEL